MTVGNLAALQMLLATYDEIFLDSPAAIKSLLEDIYEGIIISEEDIEQFLISVDYGKWRTLRHSCNLTR